MKRWLGFHVRDLNPNITPGVLRSATNLKSVAPKQTADARVAMLFAPAVAVAGDLSHAFMAKWMEDAVMCSHVD